MENLDAHPVADGLLGGEARHDKPVIMELENSTPHEPIAKLRSTLQNGDVPSPNEQAKLIEELEAEQITAGEQMYIISCRWWGDWCAYTNYRNAVWDSNNGADDSEPASRPDSIDNSDITGVDADDDLRPGLEEARDFVIVKGKSWDLLTEWYGGGPPIKRSAVLEGLLPSNKRPRVNPYPMKLEVCWSGQPEVVKPMKAEQNETVQSLKERACKLFNLAIDKVEIWDFLHRSKYGTLEDKLDSTLEEARVLEGQDILLDDKAAPLAVEDKASSSPIITSFGRSPMNRMNSLHAEDYTVQRSDAKPGLAGLSNLGNTCFMNSSLQCLMHSVPIMSVFLSGQYEQDINRTNPLGMKGQLATAFGSLMSNVWKSDVGTVCPKGFKARIAQFAPQFSGYQQHDSQEFLAFLLDGLHEDINRIQTKPYIEEPDSEGVPDEELAARAWRNYRLRNDSHIVDHFQGLYKSTLVCPQCSYSSVKFDPFMYLSLPLPESRVKQLTVVLVHADGAAVPREYGLEVPQTGTLKDLYIALARVAKLSVENPERQMVFVKMSVGYFFNFETYEDPKTRLTELGRDSYTDRKTCLVYYYTQPEYGPAAEGNSKVLVLHRKAEPRGKGSRFSAPLLLWLPLSETYDPQLHVVSSNSASRISLGLGSPAGSKDTEYIVTQEAPIWTHIKQILRPFLAVPALRQQPPALEIIADADEAQQQDDQQQGQPAGIDNVCMMQTSMVTAELSPAVSVEGSSQLQPGDPDTAGDLSKAGSEADGNNSTWGSHGSDSPRSMDQDLTGCDLEPDTILAAQQPGSHDAIADPHDAAATSADDEPPELLIEEVEADDDSDHAAATAVQELSGVADDGTMLVGAGGVPVQPLDIWAAQQQEPASTTPSNNNMEAETDVDVHWPPYLLKLARDTSDYPTTFPAWSASHSHPNQHHHNFVLDWDEAAGYSLPFTDYHAAAQQQGQQGQQQQQQQQSAQPLEDQQQQQVDASDNSFWRPDLTCCREDGVACSDEDLGNVQICGDYVLSSLQQPEYDPSTHAIKAARSTPGGKCVGLEACVEAFLQPEQLSEADEWYCPKCKTHVQADKKLDLWSLPEVLVVHLKRFSYTRWNRDKLDTQVLFPLQQLDLGRYVLQQQEQPPVYDCYAVSNHYGGLGGGHYTAFAQMPDDKKWYCFDDSRVEEISPDGVQSRAAYVLFYRRRQQAQQDPPELVEQLLHQQQQHLASKREKQRQKDQEMATSTTGNDDAAGTSVMDTDVVPQLDVMAAAPGSPVSGLGIGVRGSPEPDNARVRCSSPVEDENNAPPALLGIMPGCSSRGIAARHAVADTTSTSTSSRGVRGAEDDEDSSDGSSSRPKRGSRALGGGGAVHSRGAPGPPIDLGDSDSYLPIGAGLQAFAVGERAKRVSDQDMDADMADRDA